MSETEFVVDLHCHPNLKSFNSGHPKPIKNLWETVNHNIRNDYAKKISDRSQHILKQSQCNLDALREGNVRVINISLYPIERGFLHLRNIPNFLIGKNNIDIMQEVITGFDAKRITHLKKSWNYFDELEAEYQYIMKQQSKSSDGKWIFTLVDNFKELESALSKKNIIAGILSIEGAHVFGCGTPDMEQINPEDHKLLLSKHIKKVKSWEHPPFTINLSHHFWNQLAGHSTSFKPPINNLINQEKGKDKGITELGWHVIRELLSRENGPRILIDTKHMSVAARKEYYEFIGHYNYINPTDRIPVICSHTGMNGFSTLDRSIKEKDVPAKMKSHRLYRWSINLSNEEVRIIHQSKGLIGLMMDRGMLGGFDAVQKIAAIEDKERQRSEYCKLFWDNAFQVIKAVEHRSAWDCVALGTDFDGTITHMDPYETSAKIPDFKNDLIKFLENTRYQEDLWYTYTPKDLVRKIMQENAMRFYSEFFTGI